MPSVCQRRAGSIAPDPPEEGLAVGPVFDIVIDVVAQTKGSAMAVCLRRMRETLGDARFEALIAEYPAEDQTYLLDPVVSVTYPLHAFGNLFEHYANELKLSHPEMLQEFETMGRGIASENLNTLYKTLLGLMSTRGVVPLMPMVWKQYFKGVQVDLDIDKPAQKAEMRVRGLDQVYYMGPIATGWMKWAMRTTGTKHPEATELNSHELKKPYADELVFTLQW